MAFDKSPANGVNALKRKIISESESGSGASIKRKTDENNNLKLFGDASFDSGIETTAVFEEDDETIFNTEKEVSRFREAEYQLTKTEKEFEELKKLMETKLNEACNKLLQARIHHQQCLRALTEEQVTEEVEKH
ncbi:hypothetical protein PRIPAC_96613 [Pristionchus pacificus]|uniref:Uncharacterized protein n=1 Tax=Pristionchus pacificus TaxID=54126 RepID=A0A454Y3S7_PRIPA|nr:hypothetical protein PRIPAC_96613 [Pristionchus pacificus]|eukprot:PDM81855.1 hypothetical protein PRIPAC_34009 [Pristionchus pacificus]